MTQITFFLEGESLTLNVATFAIFQTSVMVLFKIDKRYNGHFFNELQNLKILQNSPPEHVQWLLLNVRFVSILYYHSLKATIRRCSSK